MSERSILGRVVPNYNYSFQIRDNLDPICLVWEDEVVDGTICGDMPLLRKNYKDVELDFVVYANELDIINMVERNRQWENVFTSL